MALTLAEITQAIDAARAAVPGARLLVRKDCHGEDWLVDHDTATIYLKGGLDPYQGAVAVIEAVDELIAGAGKRDRTPTLRLVPTERDDDRHDSLRNLG